MSTLKAKKLAQANTLKKTRKEEKKTRQVSEYEEEYESLSNENKVVLELCRVRDHFKKIEKFEDEEVFPPLLYISLRMYLEAVTDLEEARLEAINFLTSAIEEEFEARKYMIDHGYDQPRDSLKNLIKDKTTQIH